MCSVSGTKQSGEQLEEAIRGERARKSENEPLMGELYQRETVRKLNSPYPKRNPVKSENKDDKSSTNEYSV